MVSLLLQWIQHHAVTFEERKFPASYEEIEVRACLALATISWPLCCPMSLSGRVLLSGLGEVPPRCLAGGESATSSSIEQAWESSCGQLCPAGSPGRGLLAAVAQWPLAAHLGHPETLAHPHPPPGLSCRSCGTSF